MGEMTCKPLPLCGRLRCLGMLFLGDVCRVGDEKKGKTNLTTLMVVIAPSMENQSPDKTVCCQPVARIPTMSPITRTHIAQGRTTTERTAILVDIYSH